MSWFRFTPLALMALIAVDTTPAEARDPVMPWCVVDPGYNGTLDCSYYTKRQCLTAALGNGSNCQQNPWYFWNEWYPNKPVPPQPTFRSLFRT